MSEQKITSTMVNLTINGKEISVPKGTTVYQAAKQLGIEIPIFCYHDRMPPFGACRVCLVEVEKMARPQTACTIEVAEGMIVKTQSIMAVQGRNDILEFLLLNHPLDCPICDRGGECPLQEHVFSHGPGESRFFEEKRRFKKPLPLGPLLMLDRERCIVCARCTRFGDMIAGDHALELLDRGYRTEVGTPNSEVAESKFIGNTIMICPVGALTSQVYRFRARPWDNEPTDSTCTLCPVGCSLILDARDGEIMRTRSRLNKDVNDIWLCDKGWFGYEFTYHPKRLQKPLMRQNGSLEPVSWEDALSLLATKIKAAKPNGKLAAWGGDPLTVEENYLFQKLMRQGAGVNNVDHRIGTPIFPFEEEGLFSGMEMTIGDCEELDFAVLFGIDLTEEFPVIWLRLRQAINRGAKVVFFGHFAPEIAPYFAQTTLHEPGQELDVLKGYLPQIQSLVVGKKGAIFVGRQYLQNSNRRLISEEFFNLKQTLPNLSINILEGRGNSMGARFAGMRPDLGPMGEQMTDKGLHVLEVLENTAKEGWGFLYVAGTNPARQFPSKLWNEARSKLEFLVVQDLFLTETAEQADLVLPTLSFVEKGGSFINIERRVQILQPGKEVPENIYSDGEIFIRVAQRLGLTLTLDAHFAETLQPGSLLPAKEKQINNKVLEAPKQTNENRLLATFAPVLFDHGVRMSHDMNLVQMAKEPYVRIHPSEGIKRDIQNGDKVWIIANDSSIRVPIRLDESVAQHTAVLPLGFEEKIPVHELGPHLLNGLELVLRKEV